MACNTCAKKFTLLRKEKGCPNCGFSYCSNCLSNKAFVPKLNSEAKICTKCTKTLSTNEENVCQPPDAYFKRLAVINNSKNESTSNLVDDEITNRLEKLKAGTGHNVNSTDEIYRRLNNIKSTVPATSDAELHSRLARLKDVPRTETQVKSVLPSLDLRSEQEQADDLLKQYMAEKNIDTQYKNEFDELVNNMESRVQRLKGISPTNLPNKSNQEAVESEDEAESIQKILAKVKKEVMLEENEISPTPNDELPFCEICNEDARMRCLGCHYLFCKRCFMEHKDDEDGCDKYEPYKPPMNIQK